MKTIELTKGNVAIVDDADFEWLNQWKWCDDGAGYAMRREYLGGWPENPQYKKYRMHRLILDAPKGVFVDHINGNRSDNRRSNLRLARDWQNGANRRKNSDKITPYKGVYFIKGKPSHWKSWVAILVESSTGVKRRHSLGVYHTPEEAAVAYNEAAEKYFGEFACLNVIN